MQPDIIMLDDEYLANTSFYVIDNTKPLFKVTKVSFAVMNWCSVSSLIDINWYDLPSCENCIDFVTSLKWIILNIEYSFMSFVIHFLHREHGKYASFEWRRCKERIKYKICYRCHVVVWEQTFLLNFPLKWHETRTFDLNQMTLQKPKSVKCLRFSFSHFVWVLLF